SHVGSNSDIVPCKPAELRHSLAFRAASKFRRAASRPSARAKWITSSRASSDVPKFVASPARAHRHSMTMSGSEVEGFFIGLIRRIADEHCGRSEQTKRNHGRIKVISCFLASQ
ncbi:hypothetical protein, partial [Ralstonia sp.]|uniref:hypothetical protein n=1 Tax=Ralstonia sp. TaxID=54061 RepID=UPI00257B30B9